MRSAALLALLCTGVGSAGCGSSVAVKVAYDPSARFSDYRTFAMAEPNLAVRTDPDSDPFVLQRLRQLAFEQLSARGLLPANKEHADLVVFVTTGTRERVDVLSDNYYYGGAYYGPYGYGAPGFRTGMSSAVVVQEGLVVIDLVDRKTNSVLWRGTGNLGTSKDYADTELRDAVSQILARYPPARSEK